MEALGPEPKRLKRGEYIGPQRLPQPPTSQSYNHTGVLPPPHTYPPPQPPPPPPSPYDVGPHERSLPDPTPHAYVQEHSGHSTPVRDQRFHPEPNYSRRSSASAARSPDGHHQYPSGRSMSSATPADSQHYPAPPHQYPPDFGGHLSGYPSHEAPPNGNIHHGLPMHPYDQAHGFPPHGHPLDYNHSPVTAGPPPYGAVNYGTSFGQAGSRPLKKGNRATQVYSISPSGKDALTKLLGVWCLPY